MTTFTSLPTDVLIEFLRRLSSFKDILAMISTAKYVYETFKVHPNHILRAVICRMLPMDEEVFPVALGLVLQAERARPSDPTVTPKKSSLSDDDLSATCVTRTRFKQLLKQHKRTLRLEKDFSRLMKDSRFGYSTLTLEESRRFQITAYTYGQFQALFGINRYARVLPWEYDPESVPDGEITPRAFLDSLSTSRLCQLAIFKDFVLQWTNSIFVDCITWDLPDLSDQSNEQYCHLLLSIGLVMTKYPHQYWQTYVDWLQLYLPNFCASQKLWLADDLSASISSRTDIEYEPDNGKIVLSVGVIDIHCTRCQREAWTKMYNNTNYAELAADLSFRALLPGDLRRNPVELAAISMRLDRLKTNWTLPVHAVRGLLDPPAGALRMTQDESLQAFVCPDALTSYPDGGRKYSYNPRHMLCCRCVVGILGHRFYEWWLAERKSPRVNTPDQEDCWWGWECRTQRVRTHSEKLNHCCPKTRDAPPASNEPHHPLLLG